MPQLLHNRTKSVILIIFHLFFIILFIVLIVLIKRPVVCTKLKELTTEEVSGFLKPGIVGEISDKEAEEEGILLPPSTIFNTSGSIYEIKSDSIIVQGSGSNFVDQKPRELTLIFIDSTITLESGQKIKYQGSEGLKHLEVGEVIGISSPENIRGKTQFVVDYINK